jgi:hypothetical protein
MSVSQMSVSQMSVSQMSGSQTSGSQMLVGQISVGQMSVGLMVFGKKTMSQKKPFDLVCSDGKYGNLFLLNIRLLYYDHYKLFYVMLSKKVLFFLC